MKKVFVGSLLLVSVFLIGNAELASAQCMNYQDHECTYIAFCEGELVYLGDNWCIELCYDDGFEVYATDYDFFEGWLYPASDNKHLLGTAYVYYNFPGWSGLSIEFKGRSLISNFSFIQNDYGCTEIDECKPSNNCYFGP